MACVYLTWSLQRSPVIQALSGSLVAHSSRSFGRCLLHWRPPCSALGRFLGRLYSTYSLALPWCFSGPVMFFLFSAGGYLYPPTENRKNITGPEKHQGSARLYVEYNRPRNRPRALQGGRQCRRHRSNEREECATREPERAWITGDRWRLQVR